MLVRHTDSVNLSASVFCEWSTWRKCESVESCWGSAAACGALWRHRRVQPTPAFEPNDKSLQHSELHIHYHILCYSTGVLFLQNTTFVQSFEFNLPLSLTLTREGALSFQRDGRVSGGRNWLQHNSCYTLSYAVKGLTVVVTLGSSTIKLVTFV